MRIKLNETGASKLVFLCVIPCVLGLTHCYHGHHDDLRFGTVISKVNDRERQLIEKIGDGIPTTSSPEQAESAPPVIEAGKQTRVILQVDGGGIMGITPAVAIARLEKSLHEATSKRLRDVTSIFSGTSTGAIISGMLAAGVPASEIEKFYVNDGVELFQSKGRHWNFPIRPKFDRTAFQTTMIKALEDNGVKRKVTLGEMKKGPQLIIPSYDLRSRRTHFFTNQHLVSSPVFEENMNGTYLLDAISASGLSAAWYFGKLVAPAFVWEHLTPEGVSTWQVGAAFQDGGQGTQNNTLGILLLLALSQGWADDGQQLVVISFGTGGDYAPRPYDSVENYNQAKQLIDHVLFNQAKNESILLQWRASRLAAQLNKNVKFFRFDYTAAKGSSSFSAEKWQGYKAAGERLAGRDDFKHLVRGLISLHKNYKQEALKPVDKVIDMAPESKMLRGLIREAMKQ